MPENIEVRQCGDCDLLALSAHELREHSVQTGHKKPGFFQELIRETRAVFEGPAEWIPPGVSVGSKTIPEGPIQQVNIRDEGQGEEGKQHYADFMLPDPRLTGRNWRDFHIYSSKVRTFPFVGRTAKCSWRGNDSGLGILNRLSDDESVNSFLMESEDVRIHATERAWTIEVHVVIHEFGQLNESQLARFTSPGPQLACYQAIARHLLDTPMPTNV
jgi:hypothetical protein